MSHNSTQSHSQRVIFRRFMRIGSAAFVGASIFLPAQSLLASTYDGQGVHLNAGETVQVSCPADSESATQLQQFGDTRYYSLRCVGGSSSANSPAPTVVEHTDSGTTVHLDLGGAAHVVCYGGSANLDTAGNTRYYNLSCTP